MTAPFDAAVTGLGLVTPAGVGVAENWRRVCAGRSTARTDERLAGDQVDISCRVPDFDAERLLGAATARRVDRFVQLALVAAREAVADAGLDPASWDGDRVAVVIGNSLGGTGTVERQHRRHHEEGDRVVSPLTIPASMSNMVAGHVAIDCAARGPSLVTATACASGTTAVGLGRALLRAGQCDLVLAGGAESALSPTAMAALNRMGALSRHGDPGSACRPFDADRDGFVAAEAAGFLVLERPESAAARGARVRARVSGYGSATDAHHPTTPHPRGAGLERSIREALRDADVPGSAVEHVNAHGTGTKLNDVTEAAVLLRSLGDSAAVTSTKGVTGHALAAAGAIEAAYAVLALETGTVPPTANLARLDPEIGVDVVAGEPRQRRLRTALSTSLGFGGHNAALLLTAA
ncbi:beta-ketoacyl-[acyl-carrier-protein] synthase family protein [Saccharopolyspora sp. NPDC047091]|uniref:beta-ketoacyl-[acyl-carrier-protein] synthase family protein n=1 Tax=Saccharopolyspora sp. NPDC047091 TaxID=3155924 RepID=UPI0034071807